MFSLSLITVATSVDLLSSMLKGLPCPEVTSVPGCVATSTLIQIWIWKTKILDSLPILSLLCTCSNFELALKPC